MIPFVTRYVLPAAFSLLPPAYDTHAARAMLVAIGLQESRFLHRTQIGGAARGFWQFELSAAANVLLHPHTKEHATAVLRALKYPPAVNAIYQAIEHNDILAAIFARLLLSIDPAPLPMRGDVDAAWALYAVLCRPGAPRAATWADCYSAGWDVVEAGS